MSRIVVTPAAESETLTKAREYTLPPPTGEAVADTAAINAAIASGAKLLGFGNGTYVHTGLKIKSSQHWDGAGKGITTLQLAKEANTNSIVNENTEAGNEAISITNMTIDGNKTQQAGTNNHYGIHLIRCPGPLLSGLEIKNVDGHGLVVDGQGVVTRVAHLANIIVHDNSQIGLWSTFAMRNVECVNITAYKNGLHGIEFDASEGVATNIESRENGGRGVFVRNVFTCVFNDFRATQNAEDGIYVQGMTYSVGNNWYTGGNSTKKAAEFNEITFSGNAELSYGITNEALINNLQANPNSELGKKAAYGLYVGEPEKGAATFGSLKIFGGNIGTLETGSIRIPGEAARGNLAIIDWPSATSNLRWWTGAGLATPNGFKLGTASTHLLGFYGATPKAQPARPAASEANKLELAAIEKLNTTVEAIRKVLFENGLTA